MRSRPSRPDQGPPYRHHDLGVAILLIDDVAVSAGVVQQALFS